MVGRVKGVQYLLFALLGLVALRALYFQVLSPDHIIAQAHKRFDHAVELSPNRGTIYDRNGQPLAISLEVKSIAVNPRMLERPSQAAAQLSQVLGIDRGYLIKRFREKRYFVWIKRHADPDQVAAVKALNIRGVGFYDEAKRFYPESESLANLIGYVGLDGRGLEGLELMYDSVLKGKERKVGVHKDGMGRIIYARGLQPDDIKDGYTLKLTIDKRLQYIAYTQLKKGVIDNKAQSGFIIITNPYTGEVLSMACYPSFDPNKDSYSHLAGHTNVAVAHTFEPGSVIKPIWVSWGLNKKKFNVSQSIFCENGTYNFHRVAIHDHEKYGWLQIRDVVKFSSNIGMAKLMEPIDAGNMYSCLESFGLMEPTGIDFPGEPAGNVRSAGSWTSVDKATIAFGQGFAITGIQLMTAFNAMVNGGLVLRPYLVDHVSDVKNAVVQATRPTILRKVLSQEASQEIMGVMKTVTMKGGTGEAANMPSFQIFGKTGTAQKVDPLTGQYSDEDHISSFIGGVIDSSGKPRFTMIVCINEPHPYYYASIVACPLFKEIVSECATIMDLSPNITVAARGDNG